MTSVLRSRGVREHVELAHRIGLVDESTLSNVLKNSEKEVAKMLRSLIRAVER